MVHVAWIAKKIYFSWVLYTERCDRDLSIYSLLQNITIPNFLDKPFKNGPQGLDINDNGHENYDLIIKIGFFTLMFFHWRLTKAASTLLSEDYFFKQTKLM